MARPLAFIELSPSWITYKADVGLTKADLGKAVTLTADSTAGLGANGAPLLGKLLVLEVGFCTVHTGDYIDVPYTGAPPTMGGKVVVDGAGNVKDALVDTIPNAMKGRGEVTAIDPTTLKAHIRLPA